MYVLLTRVNFYTGSSSDRIPISRNKYRTLYCLMPRIFIILNTYFGLKQNLQGVEEAVLKNIQAVHELSEIVRTSFGPNGMATLRRVYMYLGLF